MRSMLCSCCAWVVLTTVAAAGQLTVDATGPIRDRSRPPAGGSAGSIGRKLQLRVALERSDAPQDESGRSLVEFVLTNSGSDLLTLPTSPNPGDLEPEDPNVTYTLSHMSLYVTSDRAEGSVLLPGTNLYGNRGMPGTLVTLSPGETMKVLARVSLGPSPHLATPDARVFVAHATLANETVKTINKRTLSVTQEVGSSTSPDYSPQLLVPPPR